MEHFYRKRGLQNQIFLKMYISDFLQILQKLTSSSISETRGILLRFKMAAGLKMAVKTWFFDHNSVNIKNFCVLFFAICKSSFNTNFIEEKFFIRYKMASEI
jgi:hypothetical protein